VQTPGDFRRHQVVEVAEGVRHPQRS
jgi:hypothetical protein